jgi:pimeloyl-ACP methyl ester carboxylesterase
MGFRRKTSTGPFHLVAAVVLIAAAATACGGGQIIDLGAAATTSSTAGSAAEVTSDAAPGTSSEALDETTTTQFTRLVEVPVDPPPWEDVTITTEDDVELYGRFWAGGDVAVLVQHDFSNRSPGSAGQRPLQSSENVLPFAAVAANAGYTVLSVDFRGHGESGGDYSIRDSQLDLKATYDWLVEQGHERIALVGWVGSATSGVVLDAEDDAVDFAAIAFLFSPPQETGLDATKAIPVVETPMWFVGINTGPTARWARSLDKTAPNSYGAHVFGSVPTGLTFVDVYGSELAGRLLDFLDAATA